MIRKIIKGIRKLSKTKRIILFLLSVIIMNLILLALFDIRENIKLFSAGFGVSLGIILGPIFLSNNH